MAPPPAFDETVKALAANVENAMLSLYDLQKSLVHRASADPTRAAATREVFMALRKELKKQWENLRVYLQRCHAFAADVFMLESPGATDATQLIDILTDMKDSAEELRGFSQELESKDVTKAFLDLKISTSGDSDSAARAPKAPEIKNPNLKAFVDANFAAEFPDGNKALTKLDAALGLIKSNVEDILKFWEFTEMTCQSYITGNSSPDTKTIIAVWTRYQQAIENAIVSITKTNDAILIEAVGTDTGRRQRYFGLGSIFKWLWQS